MCIYIYIYISYVCAYRINTRKAKIRKVRRNAFLNEISDAGKHF